MENLFNQICISWRALYQIFGGLWSAVLIALTVGLMIPINLGYIKLFQILGQTQAKERIRKTLSSLSVFLVSAILIILLITILKKEQLTFELVYQGALPCGIMAMTIWSLYKVIRDTGLKKLVEYISSKNQINSELKNVLPSDLTKVIKAHINEKLKEFNDIPTENLAEEESAFILDLSEKLKGFVEQPEQTAQSLANIVLNRLLIGGQDNG